MNMGHHERRDIKTALELKLSPESNNHILYADKESKEKGELLWP
jgi:hypothetical protein